MAVSDLGLNLSQLKAGKAEPVQIYLLKVNSQPVAVSLTTSATVSLGIEPSYEMIANITYYVKIANLLPKFRFVVCATSG